MKRRLLALLLAVLTLTMLTAAVFAEDATAAKGAYNIKSLVKDHQLAAVDAGDGDGGFYAGAKKFSLTCKALTGKYSLALLLQQDNNAYPTEANLYYIDQKTIEEGKATFSIIPKAMTDGATYNVYVSTNGENGSLTKVASFQYGTKPPYTLGDANLDNKVDVNDAVYVLRYVANLIDLGTTEMKAADANRDSKVDVNDAVTLLRYVTKLIPSL